MYWKIFVWLQSFIFPVGNNYAYTLYPFVYFDYFHNVYDWRYYAIMQLEAKHYNFTNSEYWKI